ncbi:hypothetical protein [Streptomyces sp. SD15]
MTTRSRTRRALRAGAGYGQLLLFAALLFGIVTMHTLGHPSGHGGDGAGPGSAHSAHTVAGVAEAPLPGMSAAVSEAHGQAAETRHAATAELSDTEMPPMSGMDPLSVCLAVLGGFALLLLLAVALGRPWADSLRPPALTRLLRALWPNPPPPRTLLSRLSVLRI